MLLASCSCLVHTFHQENVGTVFLALSEKELKKLAKAAEKEAKSEAKVEVTDTTEEALENTGGEDNGQTSEESQENQDPMINKEKTFWIEYDDFWKCFG